MIRTTAKPSPAAWLQSPPVVTPVREFADARWTAGRPARASISPDLAVGIALALAWPIALALAFIG